MTEEQVVPLNPPLVVAGEAYLYEPRTGRREWTVKFVDALATAMYLGTDRGDNLAATYVVVLDDGTTLKTPSVRITSSVPWEPGKQLLFRVDRTLDVESTCGLIEWMSGGDHGLTKEQLLARLTEHHHSSVDEAVELGVMRGLLVVDADGKVHGVKD